MCKTGFYTKITISYKSQLRSAKVHLIINDRSFSFTFAPVQTISPGEKITATATRNSTGDTSEFSAALQVLV